MNEIGEQKLDSTKRYILPSSVWFFTFAITAAACLVTADTVAVKLINILGLIVPGGAIVYPIAFIIDDIVTEVYGYRAARLIIWYGFLANFIFVFVSQIVLWLPAAVYWEGQLAYERILGYTPRLLIGAFLSYLVGSFANSIVMSRMKIITKGKALWTRTIGSTVVGQGLDSLIFVTIAYAGTITEHQLLQVIITVWLFKTGLEAILTPLTYLAVNKVKAIEKRDEYDYAVNYNPFTLK